MTLAPVPAALLLAGVAAAALLAQRLGSLVVLTAVLTAVCLRAPVSRRRVYLFASFATGLGIFLFSPLLAVEGTHSLWIGPSLPVVGQLDVTAEEVYVGAREGLRLASLALAFAAYALLLDHDRLVAAVGWARRSALAAALATRLVPTLERDAAALAEAVRGRGVAVDGLRGHARLLSPLVAGSLERASNLAEAMEARGFGGRRPTRVPRPPWTGRDRAAVLIAVLAAVVGALWL